jgi:peptidoglycan/xylan/chitin deacetylase (PgdA/CDA1 family)
LTDMASDDEPAKAGQPDTGSECDPRKKKNIVGMLVILAIAASLSVFWNFFRPVSVTVNGTQRSFIIGTSVADIKDRLGIPATPGNIVSVGGNVLEEGTGDPYAVTIDGKALAFDKGSGYRIKGDEEIQIGDGDDTMEPYTSETVEVQPRLALNGDVGAVGYVSQWGRVTKKEVRTGTMSGEVADGEVYQQGQDMVVTITDVEPTDGQKLVAITFDDGPSEYTEHYLRILSEHGAVGTFFCIGSKVEANPDTARAIVEQGSQIASHSYSHANFYSADAASVQGELTGSFDAIEAATGVKTTVFRPPYGNLRQGTWLKTNGLASVSVRWDIDTEDWRQPGTDVIVDRACSGIRPGSIILMHDGGGNRDQDLKALPRIIDRLHKKGYTFVTIDELLASDKDIPRDIATGDATMPEDATWPTEVV